MSLVDRIKNGLGELHLDVGGSVPETLSRYVTLIAKWNRVYNLTAVRDPEDMVTHHILDSLSVLPHLPDGRMLDVGSGAGLPGIPLAVASPRNVTMVDSNHKKATFITQACIELQLKNTKAVCSRLEDFNPPELYDAVVSRAFSDLNEFARLAGRFCAEGGRLYAMKGVYPYEEIALLPEGVRLDQVIPLHVPGLDAERHLVVLDVSPIATQ